MSGVAAVYTAPDGATHETVLQGQHKTLQQLLQAVKGAFGHAGQVSGRSSCLIQQL